MQQKPTDEKRREIIKRTSHRLIHFLLLSWIPLRQKRCKSIMGLVRNEPSAIKSLTIITVLALTLDI